MQEVTKVMLGPIEYAKEDLMKMDPVPLRALLHERVHHNIEVPLYPTLLEWKGKSIGGFGQQAQMVFDVWKERGLPEDAPDFDWVKEYLAMAEKIRAGVKPELNEPLPTPFNNEEMKGINKLLYGRRSVRNWIDKPVPDDMIEKILEAGRAAPNSCNLNMVRFVVIRDPEEGKLVRSDVSTKNAVQIIICYDERIPKVVGQDRYAPQNRGYDAAAAADHMLLMAHALGLGAVWLGRTMDKEKLGFPDYMVPALHIAVGWSAIGTIKSQRMPLKDMMIQRNV